MSEPKADVLRGTLDMLVLKTLALEPMHGWGLAERIEHISRGVFSINQGTLYPALQRLKRRGLVRSEWRQTENNRRARYYYLTRGAEKQLTREVSEWERTSAAVNRILAFTSAEVRS